MKKLIFATLLLCAGCTNQISQTADGLVIQHYGANAMLRIVEYKGHRFAVMQCSGRVAICEVTDASLIKAESR